VANRSVADSPGRDTRPRAWWFVAAVVMAGTTAAAMWQEVIAAGEVRTRHTGMDFASTTWHAVRGLLAGQDVYTASTRIAGMGVNWPAGEHVPATLTWQAPFAALPLWAGFFAFDFATIAAIWAAVLLLTRPSSPQAFIVAVCCGTFAIFTGAGQWTLLLGQPTGFELLGVAIIVRARRHWIAAAGFLLAASTFQTGVPLALALIVVGAWPIVWRGAVLAAALSVPPVVLGVMAAGGPARYAQAYTMGALGHLTSLPGEPRGLASQPYRIDLGALLHRTGIDSTEMQVAGALLILALAVAFLARLPADLRRLDYPPVLCLVAAVTILGAYHQPYDMLLVAGAVLPLVLLAGDRSVLTLSIFALAGVSAAVASNGPLAAIIDPVCLLAVAVLAALAARPDAARSAMAASGPAPGSVATSALTCAARLP